MFEVVSDLCNYPSWLSILPKVERVDEDTWLVELRGKIGPLARSKQLRMVRTTQAKPSLVRFERRELDGRNHSPWILEAKITGESTASGESTVAARCELTMHLHYGGTFGDAMLHRMLTNEIEASRPRLLSVLDEWQPTKG